MQAKTLSEHREYLHEIVKLKLAFLHRWLSEHPEEEFCHVLRNMVDIYRKTNANPGALNPEKLYFDAPEWRTMEDAAIKVYLHNLTDPVTFENKAFTIFKPSIDARCERDYTDTSVLSRYQCGCFRHDYKLANEKTKLMHFHIANTKMPDSIFAHPTYIKDCFFQLLDAVEQQFGAERIGTSSWLNSVPKWLALFPTTWTKNRTAENQKVQWHYGFWGQFITARGTFNFRHGKVLRDTGCFPFYPRYAECSTQELRCFLTTPCSHLQKRCIY